MTQISKLEENSFKDTNLTCVKRITNNSAESESYSIWNKK